VIRLFLLLPFFVFNLYACEGGYASCVQKVKDSHTLKNSGIYIPLQNQQRLVFSKTKPNAKILKYDKFLSLYLVKDTHPFAYPFDLNMRLQLGTALVDTKHAEEGKFTQEQIGLNNLAKYSEKLFYPALITSSCCSLEAIVTPRGIIDKKYISHFLKTKNSIYGDIGIRIEDKKNNVIVRASDPFFKHNPFKQGDCVRTFDGKRINNSAELMRLILFAKLDSRHRVKIKRGKESLLFDVKISKRYGGGELSDTFLERFGLYFDTNLSISKLSKKFKNYGLLKGDKLIQVNGAAVNTQDELRKYIQKNKDYSSLLFERDNFEFFVNIK